MVFAVSSHDLMDETYFGPVSGAFQLYGCATDTVSPIEPFLHIYHQCGAANDIKKVRLEIPVAAIGKEYNYTDVIDLSMNFKNQEKLKKFPSAVKLCNAKKPKF